MNLQHGESSRRARSGHRHDVNAECVEWSLVAGIDVLVASGASGVVEDKGPWVDGGAEEVLDPAPYGEEDDTLAVRGQTPGEVRPRGEVGVSTWVQE